MQRQLDRVAKSRDVKVPYGKKEGSYESTMDEPRTSTPAGSGIYLHIYIFTFISSYLFEMDNTFLESKQISPEFHLSLPDNFADLELVLRCYDEGKLSFLYFHLIY